MSEQEHINFTRITEAINYINHNFKEQPSLDEVAKKIHLSPFHFQRLFTDWAGVSPKKFLQYVSLKHAKQILSNQKATLSDATYETGLSSTGRLHDLFVKMEGMTPGEYKNGGESLTINYSFTESRFGNILIASTSKGICYMGFSDNNEKTFEELQQRFPKATYKLKTDELQTNALQIYAQDWSKINQIKLHLKGTDFQLKVWEALLKIPMGHRSTYGQIASAIQKPKASRAVGTAIGSNPIAFLIPCHRVIQSSGAIGSYMWGPARKTALLGWESATTDLAV